MPLVMAVLILLTGLFVADMIWQLAQIIFDVGRTIVQGTPTPGFLLSKAILLLGWLYVVAFLLRFLLPWLGYSYRNPVTRFCFQVTEPLLRPLRRIFVAGMMDFSWMIAIFLVQILTRFLAGIVGG
jgi:YggT family protein